MKETLVALGLLGVPAADGGRKGSSILCNSGVRGPTAESLKTLIYDSVYSECEPGG